MGMELPAVCAPAQSLPVTGSPSTELLPWHCVCLCGEGAAGTRLHQLHPSANQWHWTMGAVQQGQGLPCSSLLLSPCGVNPPAA